MRQKANIPSPFRSFIEDSENSWDRQQDLESLGESIMPRGSEVFYPNEYYGLDLIVKGFLDLDFECSLKLALPHGVEIGDDGIGNVFGFATNLSTLTYNNEIGLNNIVIHGVPGWRVHAEHPILLLRDIYLNHNLFLGKQSSSAILFFPAHRSRAYNFTISDYDDLICRKLLDLEKVEGKIEISLTGIDISLGRHQIYQSAGFRVVSSGDIQDPYFLSRFFNLTTQYKKVCSAEIGSHLFYSAALGCRTEFWDLGLPFVQQADTERSRESTYEINDKVKRLFFDKAILHKDIAEVYLGWRNVRPSKDRWTYIHNISRFLDSLGFAEPVGMLIKFSAPRRVKRFFRSYFKYRRKK